MTISNAFNDALHEYNAQGARRLKELIRLAYQRGNA